MARQKIVLDDAQRAELELMRGSDLDPDLARRADIVLRLADGGKVLGVAADVGVNKDAVTRWKKRWLEGGAEALRTRHGGGPAASADPTGLRVRIEEKLNANPDATWKREALAGELGVPLSMLNRELQGMGVTLERATSWEFEADAGVDSGCACLTGLFLSHGGLCAVSCTSPSRLEPVGGSLTTRDRALAGALGGEGAPIALADAIWAAADHAADPGKKVPRDLRWFVGVAASAPLPGDGALLQAVALDDGSLGWGGTMPRGLSVTLASDAADWESRTESLLAQIAGSEGLAAANRLMGAIRAYRAACLPTTEPVVWTRGAAVADDGRVSVGANAGDGDAGGGPGGRRTFATVEEALASVCDGGGDVDVCVVVAAKCGDEYAYAPVTPPIPMPPADAFSFSDAEGLMAGVGAAEEPMVALRNEVGKAAMEMLVAAAKKNSTRAASAGW